MRWPQLLLLKLSAKAGVAPRGKEGGNVLLPSTGHICVIGPLLHHFLWLSITKIQCRAGTWAEKVKTLKLQTRSIGPKAGPQGPSPVRSLSSSLSKPTVL